MLSVETSRTRNPTEGAIRNTKDRHAWIQTSLPTSFFPSKGLLNEFSNRRSLNSIASFNSMQDCSCNTAGSKNDNDVMKRMGNAFQKPKNDEEEIFQLAPFNPSSDQIQRKALEMLDLGKDDVLFDLGCGDGRFLCFAANKTPGLKCVGVEIDAQYVVRGLERIRDARLAARVDIRFGDVTKMKAQVSGEGTPVAGKSVFDLTLFDDATALYLFILPKGIVKIMPLLEALRKQRETEGKKLKILTYMFKIHDWESTKTETGGRAGCPVYLYEIGRQEASNIASLSEQ